MSQQAIRLAGWHLHAFRTSRNILFIQAFWYQAFKLWKHVPYLPLDEWANLYETLHKHCLANQVTTFIWLIQYFIQILQCIHTPYFSDVHLWHKTESLHFYSLQAKTLLSVHICFHLKDKFMATTASVLLVLLFITYLKKQCLQKNKKCRWETTYLFWELHYEWWEWRFVHGTCSCSISNSNRHDSFWTVCLRGKNCTRLLLETAVSQELFSMSILLTHDKNLNLKPPNFCL